LVDWKRAFEGSMCFIIDGTLEELSLKGIGRFNAFKTGFGRFNVILGQIGSGKTTIVNAIGHIENKIQAEFCSLMKNDARDVEITLKKRKIKKSYISRCGSYGETRERCLVIDDGGFCLDEQRYAQFLHHLRSLDCQIILTASGHNAEKLENFAKVFNDCKIIELN
jgi:Ni2+-binding GTPase involved in maturation of urease and hydrogenase